MTEIKCDPASVARLFDRAIPEPNTGCLLWTGAMDSKGYGLIMVGGRAVGAHRAVWQMINGPIARHQLVKHRCHVPLCCNPDHLALVAINRAPAAIDRKARHTP